MAKGFITRNFVWVSSEQSIEAGKVSVLALAEVAVSVGLYWAIALVWDTYLHIMISVLLAPFVLLRSEPAVAAANDHFVPYWDQALLRFGKWQWTHALALVVGAAAAFGLITVWAPWTVEDGDIRLFFAAIALGAATGITVSDIRGSLVGAFAATPVALPVLLRGQDIWIGGPWDLFAVGYTVMIVLAMGLLTIVAVLFATVITAPVGIVLRATATKMVATLRYAPTGIIALPGNWARTVLQTDIAALPELLPEISKRRPELAPKKQFVRQLEDWAADADDVKDLLGSVVFAAFYVVILFIPSVLWRYSIKSTSWLYLPLVYLASLPRWFADREERMVRLRTAPSILEWLGIGYAIISIGIAVLAAVDMAALVTDRLGGGTEGVPLPFNVLFVLDFSRMRIWDWLSLATAVLLLADAEWRSRLRNRLNANGKVSPDGWQPRTLVALARLRVVLVLAWLGTALYCSVGWLRMRGELPGWAEALIGWCPCACSSL